MITLSPQLARRLAVHKQRLAGPPAPPTPDGMRDVLRSIRCVQLDPINAVARTHQLVMWSRVGRFDGADYDALRWDERFLFEYWAHAASMVLTEDYPLFAARMHAMRHGGHHPRTAAWLTQNAPLREEILSRLRAEGPLAPGAFKTEPTQKWVSTGWTNNRNANQMLDILLTEGRVMVAARNGTGRLWDLTERFLPAWAPRETIDRHEAARRAELRALGALGVATPTQLRNHFTRGWFRDLQEQVQRELLAEGAIVEVALSDGNTEWPGPWTMLTADLPLLDVLAGEGWQPRTVLLSPFDNLICDRKRTEQLFDFHYRIEIYVPKAKRQYGYYVLPILHGDRFIGRLAPRVDRRRGVLVLNGVYAEADAPDDRDTVAAVRQAIADLAQFVGAGQIEFAGPVDRRWEAVID